jgi:hypothetical protein
MSLSFGEFNAPTIQKKSVTRKTQIVPESKLPPKMSGS